MDLDQVRFQAGMNAAEGGVDQVMQFPDSDAFVHWLIAQTMSVSTVDQITNSIETLRTNAAARPHWEAELTLWDRVIEPLLNLAVAHDQVARDRSKVATAKAEAASVVADARATIDALDKQEEAARERYEEHDQRRRDAQAKGRRAQAHRLRMQKRAAQLKANAAAERADELGKVETEASRTHKAWGLVVDVLAAQSAYATVAGLETRIEAADKESEELHRDEKRHRHNLARLLTHRRDVAAKELERASQQERQANEALDKTRTDHGQHLTKRGRTEEKIQSLEKQRDDAEQTIASAVAERLFDEGSDPATVDDELEQAVAGALADRKRADTALTAIGGKTRTAQEAELAAQRKASSARDEYHARTRELRSIEQRIYAFVNDTAVVDAAGGHPTDLWQQRTHLTDRLTQQAVDADSDTDNARHAMVQAQRITASVGEHGLLPPSRLVEECARRCQDANVPAWPGWRWLAETMKPTDAERFALARPDIVSGVVVAHADLVDQAVDAIGDLDLDVALWIGAIVDPSAAADPRAEAGSTRSRVLLPPPGVFDREAAKAMIEDGQAKQAVAQQTMSAAKQRGENARNALAALDRLWADHPQDPRSDLTQKIEAAETRRTEAEGAEQKASDEIAALRHEREQQERARDDAQQSADAASQRRVRLAPVVAADAAHAAARAELPTQRQALQSINNRIAQLDGDLLDLESQINDAKERKREHRNDRDDAANALRAAGLSPTTEGPVPDEDQAAIEARLANVRAAITEAAIDPKLRAELESVRQSLADLNSTLDADPDLRARAEAFATTDAARHPVALATATREAEERAATAGAEAATARARAETAREEYQSYLADTSDRAHPDVEGFPSAVHVPIQEEAQRLAHQLDTMAGELGEEQRREEQLAGKAAEAAKEAQQQSKLLGATVHSLRHHTDPALTGRVADDVPELLGRIGEVADRLHRAEDALNSSEEEQRFMLDSVRRHANSPQARAVEDQKDPRVIDLIDRLRGDEQLPADADRISQHLEERAASLRDDLAHHDEHVRTCATMLHIQAARAIQRLRSYRNQSRLPDGLGDWSHQMFVDITHEPVPDDESVAIDRVARVVHSQLVPGAGRSDAQTMLFSASRALVDAPFRVRLLKPHTDLSLERVDVSELKNFSGGQRVTAGVLMYATMARVRAAGEDSVSIGWLWLDNPFGKASADQLVRIMRLAADRLGLQLLFTASPDDKGALSMFDRVITLSRRSRPSAGDKVVVVDDKQREILDLTLVQKDVMAVLGE